MRETLLAVAGEGLFVPLWSDRLLEEWARAAARRGPGDEALARGDIARARTRFPAASVAVPEGVERRFWLPDPADIHVLAAAVTSSADGIVTLNARDFPRNILAEEGLERHDPDTLLRGFLDADPAPVTRAAEAVLGEANRLSPEPWTMRALMKKARLPRFGKALEARAAD